MLIRLQALFRTGNRRARTSLKYLRYRWYRWRNPSVYGKSKYDEKIFAALDYSKGIIDFAAANPDRHLVMDAELDANSVVFDVGGHVGNWTSKVLERYGARVHLFEPNPRSLAVLQERFVGDSRVHCHPFGIAGRDQTARLTLSDMGSSTHATSPSCQRAEQSVEISLRDVQHVFAELGVSTVDLIKINIEGGEYELLERMLDTGLHSRCKCIRVQFHEWFENSHLLRRRIRRRLSETHTIEWDYPFVWESW
jgi:FkbM family methyltransferase